MSAAAKISPLQFDLKLKEEVCESVIGIFRDAFSIPVKLESFDMSKHSKIEADVSGIIGLSDDREVGNLVISFNKKSLSSILAGIYGEEFGSVNDTMQQGLAEITNMIYGSLKAKTSERGYPLKMCLPSVIVGHCQIINPDQGVASGKFRFTFGNADSFQVTLTLNSGTR